MMVGAFVGCNGVLGSRAISNNAPHDVGGTKAKVSSSDCETFRPGLPAPHVGGYGGFGWQFFPRVPPTSAGQNFRCGNNASTDSVNSACDDFKTTRGTRIGAATRKHREANLHLTLARVRRGALPDTQGGVDSPPESPVALTLGPALRTTRDGWHPPKAEMESASTDHLEQRERITLYAPTPKIVVSLTTWRSAANAPDKYQNTMTLSGAFVCCNGVLGVTTEHMVFAHPFVQRQLSLATGGPVVPCPNSARYRSMRGTSVCPTPK